MTVHSWTDAVGWALLHFAWQGVVMAALLLLALSIVRNSAVRYRLCASILFIMPLLPIGTAVYLFHGERMSNGVADSPTVVGPSATPPIPMLIDGAPVAHPLARPIDPMSWVVIGWACGAICLGGINGASWIRLRRLARLGVAPAAQAWQQPLDDLKQRLGVRRVVRLLESHRVFTPAVIGHFRPVILLPIALAANLTVQQIEMILAHELSHIRRWDYLANLAQAAVETLLFYHPAVWWVSRQMRREREACCDQAAVEVCGGDRISYARTLLDLEEYRPARPLSVGAATPPLLARVHSLIGVYPRQTGRAAVAGIVLAAGLVISLVTSRLHAAPTTGPTQEMHVVTADGKPAADARLTIVHGDDDDVAAEIICDQNGIAHVPTSAISHAGERQTLIAEAAGSGVTIEAISANSLPQTLQLERSATIAVKFVDSAGRPVAGIAVVPILLLRKSEAGNLRHFEVAKPPPAVAQRMKQKTDVDGIARFSNFGTDDRVRLAVDDIRFADLDISSDLDLAEPSVPIVKTIPLIPAAVLRGTVRYAASEKPVVGVRVGAQGCGLNTCWGSAVTDEQGRYEMPRMRPGLYNIAPDLEKARLDDQWTAVALAGVVIRAGDQKDALDLGLIPGVTIQGNAVDGASGHPIEGAQIGIYGPAHPKSSAWVQVTTSDPSGHFTARVPPGEQYIYSYGQTAGYMSPQATTLTSVDGQPLQVTMKFTINPDQPVIGHVFDATGNPVAGAIVNADEPGKFELMQQSTQTDAQGRFRFDHMGDGTLLRVRSGESCLARPLRVLQANRASMQIFLKSKATTLHLWVMNPQQQPIAGATVAMMPQTSGPSSLEAHHTGGNGQYTFAAVYPDYKYSLMAHADRYGEVQQPFDPNKAGSGDRSLTVILKPATSYVAGHVVNCQPPLDGIHIHMSIGISTMETTTDASGHFRFDHVAADANFRLSGNAEGVPSATVFGKAPADDVKIRFPLLATAATGPTTEATVTKMTEKLGVGLSGLPGENQRAEFTSGPVIVQSIQPGSRAERMGLGLGDTITRINGKDVNYATDVLAAVKTGEVLTIVIERQGQTLTLTEPPPTSP